MLGQFLKALRPVFGAFISALPAAVSFFLSMWSARRQPSSEPTPRRPTTPPYPSAVRPAPDRPAPAIPDPLPPVSPRPPAGPPLSPSPPRGYADQREAPAGDPRLPRLAGLSRNMAAFLYMVSFSELGWRLLNDPATDYGYRVLVGSTASHPLLAQGYSRHPFASRPPVRLTARLYSTAAGRYQILLRYWRHYQRQLGLPDFSPESQDRYAIQQLRETGAYALVEQGRPTDAIAACRHIWASLPGAGYGQHENALPALLDAYREAGGGIG